MDDLGCFYHPLNLAEGPSEDVEVRSADVVEDVQCIFCGVGESGVAWRGGDPDKVDIGVVGSIDDGEGVVQAGIAVQPNGCLLTHISLINTRNSKKVVIIEPGSGSRLS